MAAQEELFRPEALEERRTGWLGTVLLLPRLSWRFYAAYAVLTAAGLLALLFLGSYTRKARINGWLVPRDGMVKVFAPISGVVTEMDVEEGRSVKKGDRLLVISSELRSAAIGATETEVARRLQAQRDNLSRERVRVKKLYDQQAGSLADRIAVLQAEGRELDGEIHVQRWRVRLARRSIHRQRRLHHMRLASDEQLQTTEEAWLDQDAKLRELERSRTETQRNVLILQGDLKDLPLKCQAEVATVERNIAAIDQQLAEAEARRAIVVPAPESGIVTAIQAERGGRTDTRVPLLSIVPEGSTLEAHLFSPSSSVGFLRPGQRVLLRYQAYPYQKFGHYEGTLASISRSAFNPGELPPQLAGLTSLYGTAQPVYRITVALARQSITAYGRKIPLTPGMQLQADVVIERRRLIEWALEPLFTLTGSWKG